MGYDRYPRNDDWSQGDRYRDDNRSRDRDDRGRGAYGAQGSGGASWQQSREGFDRGREGGRDYYGGSFDRSSYGADRGRSYGGSDGDFNDRGARGYESQGGLYRGSYANDGHRFADYRDQNDRGRSQDRDRYRQRDAMEYDADDRGFLARAGDEVRSWFGDEDAERRRERDQRYDEQMARYDTRNGDHAYRSWRDTQVSAFDRDYDEYRQENATKFQNEFAAFRTERQTQRDSLTRVAEHMEVLGSDGEHVGTVDKVRGDRIILTKNDVDAGGHHHSIPSRWLQSVDDKVTLRKSAAEAKKAWRDEEEQQALFGNRSNQPSHQRYGSDRYGNEDRSRETNRYDTSATTGQALTSGTSTTAGTGVTGDRDTNLNRSFPGTY